MIKILLVVFYLIVFLEKWRLGPLSPPPVPVGDPPIHLNQRIWQEVNKAFLRVSNLNRMSKEAVILLEDLVIRIFVLIQTPP